MEDAAYDSYDPLVLQQAASQEMRRFESFDAALDEFYSKVHPGWLCTPPVSYHVLRNHLLTSTCTEHALESGWHDRGCTRCLFVASFTEVCLVRVRILPRFPGFRAMAGCCQAVGPTP